MHSRNLKLINPVEYLEVGEGGGLGICELLIDLDAVVSTV